MDTRPTMLKIAYLKGLEKVAETQNDALIKEALFGNLVGKGAKALGKLLYRPATRAAATPGTAATGFRKALGLLPKEKVVTHAEGLLPELGRFAGQTVRMGVGKGKPMSHLYKTLTMGGRRVPATMLGFGTFSGGMGGLTGGRPGEGWSWSGAGKGFLGGAAGGLGWAGGGHLARKGLGKMLSSKAIAPGGRLAGFAERGKKVWGLGGKEPGFWAKKINAKPVGEEWKQLWRGASKPGQTVAHGLGESAKNLGTKAALGVPIAASVFGGDIAAEHALDAATREKSTPYAWPRRGAYAMTRGGRAAYY